MSKEKGVTKKVKEKKGVAKKVESKGVAKKVGKKKSIGKPDTRIHWKKEEVSLPPSSFCSRQSLEQL